MIAKTQRTTTLRPLTRQEIERTMQELIANVAAAAGSDRANGAGADGFQWIAPAELVRRVRPYVGMN